MDVNGIYKVCRRAMTRIPNKYSCTCYIQSETTHSVNLHPLLQIPPKMGAIIVINNSAEAVKAFVSNYSNGKGSDDWYTLGAGQRDSWDRDNWELVAFKDSGDTQRAGVYVPVGSVVTFSGFDNVVVS